MCEGGGRDREGTQPGEGRRADETFRGLFHTLISNHLADYRRNDRGGMRCAKALRASIMSDRHNEHHSR